MLLVHITKVKVKCGRKISPCFCPIALACDETIKSVIGTQRFRLICVGSSGLSLTIDNIKQKGFDWPIHVKWFIVKWIERFDKGYRVNSFSFEFPELEQYLKTLKEVENDS